MAENKENRYVSDNAQLMTEWDWKKNKVLGFEPNEVTFGSIKKIWWICDKGHEWQATPNNRSKGQGCPVCAGRKVFAGFNDLASKAPDVAKEWHPTKNGDLLPTQIAYGSDNRYLYDGKTEIDIYLPEYNIGIEYDGYYYHKGNDAQVKEAKKDALLNSKGIRIIRVKEIEKECDYTDTENVIFCKYNAEYSYIKGVIERLLERIAIITEPNFVSSIDISSATPIILSAYLQYEKENSLATKSPEIAAEWHPTRNGYVTPEMISYASGRKVWWLGKCGHEWQMSVESRNRGGGCPFCSGKRILVGFNDLQTTHPELVQEWDYKKNLSITPESISYGSNKKVWWICSEGHSYQATPSNRAFGKGCPICGKVKRARNRHLNHIANNDCLDITHPHLCDEWNQELNGDIFPSMVTRGSNFKAWWNCEKGHSYQATVANRVAGKGCPICAGKKIVAGINDLVTLNPKLTSEWDYVENTLDPQSTSPNSHKKAYWICSVCGNKWEAQIKSRNTGTGCPKCAREKRNKTK